MKVLNLELKNYRNYENLNVEFSPFINVLVGKNAQGKTNMLEAIFLSAIGKSLRTNKETDLINWNEQFACVKCNVQKKYLTSKIELFLNRTSKKTIKINSLPIRRIGDLLGELNCVYFSPDELKLIKESPEDRRRFMDIDISQTSKQYFYLLGRYNKTMSMRNKLLKTYKDKVKVIKTPKSYKIVSDEENIKTFHEIKMMLDVYSTQLAEIAGKIVAYRQIFISELLPYAQKSHAYLTSNSEELFLEYSTDIELLTDESNFSVLCENYKNKMLDEFNKNIEKDLYLTHTSVGPHRDDIKVLVNNIDVREFGSQGQQRTTALSMKLAEVEIIRQKCDDMPILILDDVLSELDEDRRNKLLKFCVKCQTFISSTEFNEKVDNVKIIKIEKGKLC